MNKIKEYERLISRQLEENIFKNLFDHSQQMYFDNQLCEQIKKTSLNDEEADRIVRYCCDNFIYLLYTYNQYINFSKADCNCLEEIYRDLLMNLYDEKSLKEVEEKHFKKIRKFLILTNPFLMDINKHQITTFVNQEYSVDLQLKVLKLDINTIQEPVLDIGCGQNHNLVNYLNSMNIIAFGIDRYESDNCRIIKDDFLNFYYKEAY